MKEEIRQANKAAAAAVRQYLETLGMELSHVQALEVIARGNGMRSRHLLADGSMATANSPAPTRVLGPASPMHCTKVSYAYIDGSNSKRFSSLSFRGRLTKPQLQLIESKLLEGLFFVPAQVGFESLHFAFTDDGGDDQYCHKLELGDSEDWVLDSEGYILRAGDVEQVESGAHPTDADCENLTWRFARVLEWDESLQEAALTKHAYKRPRAADIDVAAILDLVQRWKQCDELCDVADALLQRFAEVLLCEGFEPVDGLARELRREIGPNAYQFCLFEKGHRTGITFQVNYDISTNSGSYVTESPMVAIAVGAGIPEAYELLRTLNEQAMSARSMPEVYDPVFA
jgi:hypothetical protein